MPDFAIHPPVHVTTHPDEPIRSVSAAIKFVRRHDEDRQDPQTIELLARLEGVSNADAADGAGWAFAEWAGERHLLLAVPTPTMP